MIRLAVLPLREKILKFMAQFFDDCKEHILGQIPPGCPKMASPSCGSELGILANKSFGFESKVL